MQRSRNNYIFYNISVTLLTLCKATHWSVLETLTPELLRYVVTSNVLPFFPCGLYLTETNIERLVAILYLNPKVAFTKEGNTWFGFLHQLMGDHGRANREGQ